MSKTYNINLSKQERQMMEAWDKQDPISEWEETKIKRIKSEI
jgi:deoxyribonuclease-1